MKREKSYKGVASAGAPVVGLPTLKLHPSTRLIMCFIVVGAVFAMVTSFSSDLFRDGSWVPHILDSVFRHVRCLVVEHTQGCVLLHGGLHLAVLLDSRESGAASFCGHFSVFVVRLLKPLDDSFANQPVLKAFDGVAWWLFFVSQGILLFNNGFILVW